MVTQTIKQYRQQEQMNDIRILLAAKEKEAMDKCLAFWRKNPQTK